MGVNYLQHRIVIGNYHKKVSSPNGKRNPHGHECNDPLPMNAIFNGCIITIYVYALCILLAGVIRTTCDVPIPSQIHIPYNVFNGSTHLAYLKDLLNTSFLFIISILYSKRKNNILKWAFRHSYIAPWKSSRKQIGVTQKTVNTISLWTSILNLTMIVLCNPCILNPGPLKPLTIFYQNARGFVPFSSLGEKIMPLDTDKILNFQSYIFENKPDVVILNETWLSKEHFDNEIFPNDTYQVFRLDRSTKSHPPDPLLCKKFKRKGGGIVIAVKSTVEIEAKEICLKSKAEILSINLKSNDSQLCITTCYRVGTLGEQNLIEIEKHLRNVISMKKYKAHVIIGDFNLSNISWSNNSASNELERSFLDMFNDLGLSQMIQTPTHEKGRILDILLTNVPGIISNINVLDKDKVCNSDHFGILFDLKTKIKHKNKKVKLLNYKKANWEGLNTDLKSVKWDRYLKCSEPEYAWSSFKNILFHFINKHIPTITVKNHDQPPWYDNEVHDFCRKKERLRSKFKDSGIKSDYEQYSKCRKEFKRLVKDKMLSNFEDNEDPSLISKKFWAHLKSTSKSTRIPESVHYKGRIKNTPIDQAEMFNEYFKDQFSDASAYDIDVDFRNDESNDIDFNFSRIHKLLKKTNTNKAPGPDGIHGNILKHCSSSLAYPLSLLFKVSYSTGCIPNDWKTANVVPVHKKGDKGSVENYRPISLTSLVMKIFEKVIRDELLAKCQNKLNPFQHGFLPQKSCTTQMLLFTDSLSLSLNDKVRADVVYFDFAKAFDSVNHDIIISKLKNEFGINGSLLKFIVNYLQHRKQCVLVNGAKSGFGGVSSGVPQGSILGPLLFVLFINDMAYCVDEHTNIALYADDTKIWRRIESWNDHIILQNDIDLLHRWSIANKIKFHPKKCKVLPVSPTIRSDSIWNAFPFQDFYYSLNGNDLEFVKNEIDLGVNVTTSLNWHEQCLALHLKASSRLGLLKRIMHFVKDIRRKRVFYLAIVRSIFEHCSTIWRPINDTMIIKLESVQRRAVKWILSELDHHYSDFEYLKRLKDLEILPLKYKFDLTDLLMFHKIFYDLSVIKLPSHLRLLNEIESSRLRPIINPPNRISENVTTSSLSQLRTNRSDRLSLKCTVDARAPSFKSSFFFRTHLLWNFLPTDIKEITCSVDFKDKLVHHMWDIILDPH